MQMLLLKIYKSVNRTRNQLAHWSGTREQGFQQVGDEEQIVSGIITPTVSEVLKAATANKTAEQIITKRAELKRDW